MCLPQPTSGLDAATALLLVKLLRELASGAAMQVLCSVHQPRSNIFSSFHRLLLLARGQAVYSGPVCDAVAHFERVVGASLPPFTNPADWLIDLIDSGAAGAPAEAAASGLATPAAALASSTSTRSARRWQTSSFWQFRVLLLRSSKQQRGEVAEPHQETSL